MRRGLHGASLNSARLPLLSHYRSFLPVIQDGSAGTIGRPQWVGSNGEGKEKGAGGACSRVWLRQEQKQTVNRGQNLGSGGWG